MLSRQGMGGGNGCQAHMTEPRARSVTGAVSVIMKPLRMILNLGKGSALTAEQEWTGRTETTMNDINVTLCVIVAQLTLINWHLYFNRKELKKLIKDGDHHDNNH